MAGRNKRAAVSFLRQMAQDLADYAQWLREQQDKAELVARGIEGVAADVAEGVNAYLLGSHWREFATLRSPPVATVMLDRDWYARSGLYFEYAGHADWRGNRVNLKLSLESLIGRRREIVRDMAGYAADRLGKSPCAHARKGRMLDVPKTPMLVDALALDIRTASVRTFIGCEDCGAELGGRDG